jgi:DNA-binding transcriptional LysR family regulator
VTSILKHVRRTYPKLRLHVSIEKSRGIEDALHRNEFDIGIPMRIAKSGGKAKTAPSIELAREPLHWLAAKDAFDLDPGPLPLILLPESCSLHRLVLQELRRRKLDFYVAHTASGVAGAQQALLAGLGVTCLNDSARPANVRIMRPGRRLPRLPEVEFSLLSAPGVSRSPLVSCVKSILMEQFAQTD